MQHSGMYRINIFKYGRNRKWPDIRWRIWPEPEPEPNSAMVVLLLRMLMICVNLRNLHINCSVIIIIIIIINEFHRDASLKQNFKAAV